VGSLLFKPQPSGRSTATKAARAVFVGAGSPRSQEIAMRLSLIMLIILGGTAALDGRAEAQNYPWCAQYSGNMGGAMNCGFSTYPQCMEDVSGIGGFCMVNNRYVPPVSAAPSRQEARKHHASKRF